MVLVTKGSRVEIFVGKFSYHCDLCLKLGYDVTFSQFMNFLFFPSE